MLACECWRYTLALICGPQFDSENLHVAGVPDTRSSSVGATRFVIMTGSWRPRSAAEENKRRVLNVLEEH